MCIEDELDALREDLAALMARTASVDDWRKLDARAYLLLLAGQMQLASLQRAMPSPRRSCLIGDHRDVLDEIRTLRACAQRQVCELDSPHEIAKTG